MSARRLFAPAAAIGTLAAVIPAPAQAQSGYEYAVPAPADTVIFRSDAVVQPLPVPPPAPAPPVVGQVLEDEDAYTMDAAPLPPPPAIAPPHGHVRTLPQHPYVHAMPPYAGYHPAPPPHFDRDRWLDECRERIRGVRREDRAGVIGGLLGAAVGGVAGNRLWDSERLAGTLLGAGVGGLAGIAIGAAIGAAGDRRREDECALHLDRYMAGGYPGHGGYPGYGHGYGYAYPAVTYVPVLVAIPQRAVIRETVTEEWVDVPAPARTYTETKIIRQGAPAARPDKRVKIIKGR